MISFAAIYYMVPRLWNRDGLYSLRLINWHFWLATLGIVIYAAVLWVAGITQGLMWREYDAQGFLVNSFVETVEAIHWAYAARAFGGVLYLAGALVMVWNIYQTIRGRKRTEAPMTVAAMA
jgi:cytochrome c oxidase cbb3-type subunit 1